MKVLILTLLLSSTALAEPNLFPTTGAKRYELARLIEDDGSRLLGVRYIYGAGPFEKSKAFDCSSLVKYLYQRVGIILPRASWQQASVGVLVKTVGELRYGDIVFFKKTPRHNDFRINHVAIYLGENRLLHTFKEPRGVTITKFMGLRWGRHFSHGRRVIPEDPWLVLPPFYPELSE